MHHTKALFAALACTVLLGLTGMASAQYPSKPIRLVVGYTAGGGADVLARAFSDRLSKLLGQPIVMEYRPGAGATVAAEAVSRAPADGYTLHITDSGPMTIVPHMRKLGYDPLTSFTPITILCSGGTVIVVHPSNTAKDLRELIATIRAQPDRWSYGTSGVGGVGHLAAELFQTATQTKMVHIPYKGGAPAVVELMGGQVPLLFSSLASAMPQIKAGRIRALAVTSAKRSSMLPESPALSEIGFPGFDASIWFGIVGPPNLPQEVMDRLVPALQKVLQEPPVQESIRAQGYDFTPTTPAEAREVIRKDYASWGKVVREAGITSD